MRDIDRPPSVPFPPEPLYMGSLTTYSGPGHLGPVLVRGSHILYSDQRSVIQRTQFIAHTDAQKEEGNLTYMPMRSFASRAPTSKPLIEACPFRVAPAVYSELVHLEALNTACYPAHPFEAYNVESYYAASNFISAEVSNYRSVLISVYTGAPSPASHTFRFSGVVCSVYVDRHLLLVRTTYEVYGALIFSDIEMRVLQRKLSRCDLKSVEKLFYQTASGIYFYPVVQYVRMDRSISRVAASRLWADIPAVSREIALCVTHWDGTVKVFLISDNLLATARIAASTKTNNDSAFNCKHRPIVFMVSELSLPSVQPYSLSATPMGYIPVLAPEPLALFSGTYPDRLYVAYGDMLFFSTLPLDVSSIASSTVPRSNEAMHEIIDRSKQTTPAPTFSSARGRFCEVGDRTSFTALQHCRNSHILIADTDFLWVFSEQNLIEPLVRLRHSLNRTAPIRTIHSISLVPEDSAGGQSLPFFCINETDTTVESFSEASVARSLELVLLLNSVQAASTVIGVDSDTAGIVFSLPYLLMQAPVQSTRLWRTPMITKIESDSTHLRALTPHGALLGNLDLWRYNYITGVSIRPKLTESERRLDATSAIYTHLHHRTCREEDVALAMAAFAGYYPLPEVSEPNETSANDIGTSITNKPGRPDGSMAKKDSDTEVHEYASFRVELTLVFLSGERVTIDWSAKGVKNLTSLLNYPANELVDNREGDPLLSYERMISLLRREEDGVHIDLDSNEGMNTEHRPPTITCVYMQSHAERILSWINGTSAPHLQAHAHSLLSQLAQLASQQRPCIPLKRLHSSSLRAHLTDNPSSAAEEPRSKRLMDSKEWSEGVIRSIFPMKLFECLTNCVQSRLANTVDLPGEVSEQAVLPSSGAGVELVRQWMESEPSSMAHLFEAQDDTRPISTPLLTDPPKSLSLIAPDSDGGVLEETEVHTQNIDFLIGLMKAVP